LRHELPAAVVSTRTIKRDISTLQHGGFPVWARPGPGGGYVVDKATTLPPVNFTDAEVAGLAAAVAAHRGQPFDGYARAALVNDRQTERRIDPVALARTAGQWYLVGNCRTREAIRWFRLDRTTSARLTTEPSATVPVEDIGTPPATAKATADF